MSDVKWTDAQLDAINARGGPLLVSAAAGSGKTAVLVQRVVELITAKQPVDIDRFLIVTFTNAAADEMRQRIADRLEELLCADPFNENLIRQQLLLAKAQISTIDSFCNALAREYFYALDIPADFRIADEEERTVMKETAMNNVFDGRYSSHDGDFLRLVNIFSDSHDDAGLRSIVGELYRFLEAQPFPERWLKENLAAYDDVSDPAETPWGRVLKSSALLALDFIMRQSRLMIEAVPEEMTALEKVRALALSENAMVQRLERALNCGSWDEICAAYRAVSFERFPAPRKLDESEAQAKAQAKSYRDAYKKEFEKLSDYFSKSSSAFVNEINEARPTVAALFSLASEFGEEYGRIKSERGVAEFGDVEHWALRLLVTDSDDGFTFTEKAAEISQRYDFVMVDEYQDTNLLQDLIFKAVSANDKKLFIVGDVKQSIYRFRQSNPEIFISRKDSSVPYKREGTVYPARINLDANFRSRSGVTDCVNFVFSKLMTKRAAELDYTSEEALKPLAAYPPDSGDAVTFHLLESADEQDETMAREARYIAGLIYKMINEENVTDKTGTRSPRFGDFCILLRTKKNAAVYSRELLRLGIPSVCEQGEGFFSQPEIRLMVSLLRSIDNPARDIPLAAALLSPVFGFTADELGRLRAAHRDKTLYEMLLAEREKNEKAEHFLSTLERLRAVGSNLSADEFINRIYDETLLPEIVLSDDDGEFRRKNLRLLTQYAKKYEATGFRGLSGFVKFLDKLSENDYELSAADRTGIEAANAVSIMTIHKSKGLEFPVCIVASLGSEFNNMDVKGRVILHDKLGMGTNVISADGTFRYKGLIRKAVDTAKTAGLKAEELRLLYVAMTRARERLVLVASVKSIEAKLASVGKKLVYDDSVSPYSVSAGSGFSDWLLYCQLLRREDDSVWRFVEVFRGGEEAHTEESAKGTGGEAPASEEKIPDRKEVEQQLSLITEKLSRRYSFAKASSIPVKVAASAVAERESGSLHGAMSRPSFMNDGGMSAAEKGTALHEFVQRCDFDKAKLSVDDEKRRLVERGFLTQRQADCISEKRLGGFLSSRLLACMQSAQLLEREYRFTVEIPAGLADRSLMPPYSEEKIVLQGAIDALYVLDGELVIVDYKTDRVKLADELKARYSPQLRLYKYAVEQIFGKEVSRCVLYSFTLGCEIELDM